MNTVARQLFVIIITFGLSTIVFINITYYKLINPTKIYGNRLRSLPIGYNSTCALFPRRSDIFVNNKLWQIMKTSERKLYLFSAYFDNRLKAINSTIRILALINDAKPKLKTFCQIWFKNRQQPSFSKVVEYARIWFPEWGANNENYLNPFLISCMLHPGEEKVPQRVSLVAEPCENATNLLKVNFNRRIKKKNFAICVKGLHYPEEDVTPKLAEWIEMNRILGADKIIIYNFGIHPNMRKLLNYYETKGIAVVLPLTIAGNLPNDLLNEEQFLAKNTTERRLQEVIPYNDCFYKNMYNYRYIVALDIDEVIMPKIGNWNTTIRKMESRYGQNISAFFTRQAYFLDRYQHNHPWFSGIPRYMHILQHVYRSKNYSEEGYFTKSFHNTEEVLTLHNHLPVGCLTPNRNCINFEIDIKTAHLQHYRQDCPKYVQCQNFAKSILDTKVWRFKNELVKKVNKTLTDIKYLPKQ